MIMPLSNVTMSLLVIVALASRETALAWMTMSRNSVSWRLRSTTTLLLAKTSDDDSKGGPDVFDDEDCFDLCDDWEASTNTEKDSQETTTSFNGATEKSSHQQDHHKPSFQRMRLEMQWELRKNEEDCDLEEIETCGDFCADCVGVGSVTCRFCGGKGKLYLPPTNLYGGERIQPCPVCNQQGTEVCKSCRGSGRIAPWTSYSTSS